MLFKKLKLGAVFKSGVYSLLDLVYPPHCIVCAIPFGERPPFSLLCEECRKLFAIPEGQYCRRCGGHGRSRNDELQMENPGSSKSTKRLSGCASCRGEKFVFSHCFGLGEYRAELRAAVLRMKNDRSGLFAISAARLLHEQRRDRIEEFAPEWIVPVPMHFVRRMVRGVNGPEIFARELSRLVDIPCSRILKRVKATKLQRTLSPRERRQNLDSAISLPQKNHSRIAGRRILLADDILTTGATANACAKLLLEAGAASVGLAVIARAEGTNS